MIERRNSERRRYSDEFKHDAVELLARPGAELKELARGLGIPAVTLRQWRDRLVGRAEAAAGLSAAELAAENRRRLREQLVSMTMQRDVLKKACGILSEAPPKGMAQ
ncbi:MAG TPA: transposase [Candidatus Methylacidiphilales bacterium]|jgi:transposase|nr:transposase [Candidatus Methylacidiphilales bacterium]